MRAKGAATLSSSVQHGLGHRRQQRHTHAEWLKLLRKIDRETPKEKTLHLFADNYATHKHPVVCLSAISAPQRGWT